METQLNCYHNKKLTLKHEGPSIIIEHITSDGVVVSLEVLADELLQAVKAHHALTKSK